MKEMMDNLSQKVRENGTATNKTESEAQHK